MIKPNTGVSTRIVKPTLLRSIEEIALVLVALIDIDDLGSGKELHDEARGDDGRDTELHEGA